MIAPPKGTKGAGTEAAKDPAVTRSQLPDTFLFAGSQLRDNGPGPRQYLADLSGNLISIATFGDEVLCLPFHQTQDDGGLMWHVKEGSLPKVGTKVTLRLRLKPKSKPSADKTRAESRSRKRSK